ncbi:MAG: type II secretion system F family protein [bacterium]
MPATSSIRRRIGEATRRAAGTSAYEYVRKLDRTITAAGMEHTMTGVDMLGEQVISLVLFPAFWLYVFSQLEFFAFVFEGPLQVVFYLLLIAGGFFFPTIRVRDRIKSRHELVAVALPDAVDLLTISVEAGLDFMTALRRVVDKQRPGPLKDELDRFFRQIELGRTRRDALKELANRVQLDDLSNTCSSLIQADRLGSSIAPVLRTQSDVLRTRRMQRAEKKAMEAPIKMMAPLLACIFPAVFIIIFAPLFIQMWQNLTR